MCDLPPSERPRERLARVGPEALRSAELIAILLRTGVRGRSAVSLADELTSRFGSLRAMSQATLKDLRCKGIGPDKALTLQAAFALGKRLAQEVSCDSAVLDNPASIAGVVREELANRPVEQLRVLLLNTRLRLIQVVTVADGTLDQIVAHPREVFRSAVNAGAFAIALAHNHPSGDPTPSDADVRATRDLVRAGQVIKIQIVDHVIIGRPTPDRSRDWCSLRELGFITS